MLNIPGIDTKKGLASTMGKEDRYRRLLKIFYAEGRQKHDEIRIFVKDKDINSYRISVHGLKSTAITVGAVELGAEAAALEDAARTEDWDFINAQTDGFLARLNDVLDAIDNFLAEAAPTVAVDKTRLAEILNSLRRAIDAFDLQAINAHSIALKGFLEAPEIGKDIERILGNKRGGEYATAAVDIDVLLAKL